LFTPHFLLLLLCCSWPVQWRRGCADTARACSAHAPLLLLLALLLVLLFVAVILHHTVRISIGIGIASTPTSAAMEGRQVKDRLLQLPGQHTGQQRRVALARSLTLLLLLALQMAAASAVGP
jgi:hypothetical protein